LIGKASIDDLPQPADNPCDTPHATLKPNTTNVPSILIVEDELLLALSLEEDLRDLGCAIVGPYAELDAALTAAREEAFDLAVLDVNLNGRPVFPLAEELLERGIPVLLLSGYAPSRLPETLTEVPRLAKPYDRAGLIRKVERLLAAKDGT
jgi:CheY-like chemotaxis protein